MGRVIDQIFLDKGKDTRDLNPDAWKYFRVTGVGGLGNADETEGASLQVSRVKWPTLEDIPPTKDSPGVMTYGRAWEIVNGALRQWGIDRARSIFIGVRDREE